MKEVSSMTVTSVQTVSGLGLALVLLERHPSAALVVLTPGTFVVYHSPLTRGRVATVTSLGLASLGGL